MQRAALVLLLLGYATAVEAQTAPSRCASIKSDAARLACYDRIFPPAKKPTTKARIPSGLPTPKPNRATGER